MTHELQLWIRRYDNSFSLQPNWTIL